jgi:prophage regulatory protein
MVQQQILRLPAVLACTGLSRSTVYAAISRNEFLAPIPLGARAVGWLTSDIDTWVQSRIHLGRSAHHHAK